MRTEAIKNFSGTILGYIDHKDNGDQVLKNYSGTILGTYNKNRDITQNYSGTILSSGNTLTTLLR